MSEEDRRLRPPPGWLLHESQNLYKPFRCERIGTATSTYATEQEAIDDAWRRVDAEKSEAEEEFVETATACLEAVWEKLENENPGKHQKETFSLGFLTAMQLVRRATKGDDT